MVDFCVVGVGSPHGDDQVGWRLVELLKRKELPDTDVVAVRGAVSIVDYLQGCRTAILIDACRSGAPPGTITRLVWPDPRVTLQHDRTTHGISLASALELARRLNSLPERIVVYGVEMASCEPGAKLNPAVEVVLPDLARQVLGDVCPATQGVARE